MAHAATRPTTGANQTDPFAPLRSEVERIATEAAETKAEEAVRRMLEEHAQRAEDRAPSPGYISNTRAKKLLGVGRTTLQRWRESGRLPYRKVGAIVFYRVEDLHALIESDADAVTSAQTV